MKRSHHPTYDAAEIIARLETVGDRRSVSRHRASGHQSGALVAHS